MVNKKLEEFSLYIRNKKVAIIGLGISNMQVIKYLLANGANVKAFHNKAKETLDTSILEVLETNNITCYFGENYLENLNDFDLIIRSPSARPDLPEIQKEVEKGAILTSEIELVMEMCPGKIIAVTGSDGKTTTTSLIYEIVKKKGYRCYLGGNIGTPLFEKLSEMEKEDVVVLELSSFQLMTMEKSPDIAVITNISPNHLDIHESYEEYINAKANIFTNQNEYGVLVTNYDNEITKKMAEKANGKVVFFSRKSNLENGVVFQEGIVKTVTDGLRRHVLNTKNVHLRGVHNYENICAAVAATIDIVDIDTIKEAVEDFKGVEHRLEFVREVDKVKWYNDSIGTSPTRTIAGLNAFEESIVLIAGGYDKNLDYEPLAEPIIKNVTKLILMGKTAEKIRIAVENKLKESKTDLQIYNVVSLEEAVSTAKKVARKDEIVLFSPASASFDSFKNFAERGNKFKEIVEKL
ncbi:MAG: UDP-N-acetylmuramoyl-L-alanine--D-glutamate ligase [Lachnospiraceae bacterium]|nr:UDP-N-acetylmuramoyl-L-alanine--D-glutamate ligase [Lachnospiraceae bacterium]